MKKQPTRRCIVCNEKKEKRDLLRIVRTPERKIEIDLTGKKNGRGAYICKKEECLNKAIKTKKIDKIFEMNLDGQIYENIRGVIIDK
ncbi:MAG: RNase P modulator RnpM [Candidatus Scatovivens sp.]